MVNLCEFHLSKKEKNMNKYMRAYIHKAEVRQQGIEKNRVGNVVVPLVPVVISLIISPSFSLLFFWKSS